MKFLDELRASLERPEVPAESQAGRYALEIRAVRRTDGGAVLTPLGKLVLDLPAQDTVRWLLAVEAVQSLGARDTWRLSREAAARLLKEPSGAFDTLEDESEWFVSWPVLDRLSRMGLLRAKDHHPVAAEVTYDVLPERRGLLEEIASGRDTPFMLLARALLQDETAAVLAQYPSAAAMVRTQSATTVAIRHARMVAHEIRNALVPVRSRLTMLYSELERREDTSALLAKHRAGIDAGIERLFDFVQENADVAHLVDVPADTVDLAFAIQSAIASVAPESAGNVSFTPEPDLPRVIGHRERFVMALANILRNASQARTEPPVTIRVTAGLSNGAAVFVHIDDDGPGVAPNDRANLFSPGFSRRSGGSGQGLAFVREVVEEEMAGQVAYEDSPMGGARFIIRLPVGTRRSR